MARKPTKSPADGQEPKAAPKPRKGGRKPANKAAPAAAAPSVPSDPSISLLSSDPVPATPKKRGRPSKYDPAFCETVIELGELGKSLTQIAAKLGVLKETMMDWTKTHPDFSAAIKEAQQHSQAWWEDQGQAALGQGKDFNATAFIFQMKNRFKNDYSDKIEVKHDATAAFSKIWQHVGTGKLEGTAQ